MVTTEEKKARMRAFQKRFRQRKRALAFQYLKTHPCVDCKNPDPRVLDFDHQRDKSFNIGKAISSGHVSWEVILKEIEKCEVRCANCHRIRHAIQNNWYDFPADILDEVAPLAGLEPASVCLEGKRSSS